MSKKTDTGVVLGRPRKFKGPARPVTVYLPQDLEVQLLKMGGGNLSRGVRLAVWRMMENGGSDDGD